MAEKLAGARFRFLNETLYSQPGAASLAMMRADPAQFTAYHAGYRAQVAGWPENPLDRIIAEVRKGSPRAVVADLGCGEARLAASVPNLVHSFDLVAASSRVTACDIADLPLEAASVDIAVFCLSLMGTDFLSFLREAARVLRAGGRLIIAEVKSRFETASCSGSPAHGSGSSGGFGSRGHAAVGTKRRRDELPSRVTAEPAAAPASGLQGFLSAVAGLGFDRELLESRSNAMFVMMHFRKRGPAAAASAVATSRVSSAVAVDLPPVAPAVTGDAAGPAASGAGGAAPLLGRKARRRLLRAAAMAQGAAGGGGDASSKGLPAPIGLNPAEPVAAKRQTNSKRKQGLGTGSGATGAWGDNVTKGAVPAATAAAGAGVADVPRAASSPLPAASALSLKPCVYKRR